jgi:hypothetical protein
MTKSTFYHDGYKAGLKGFDGTPPNVAAHANEYWDGYQDAAESLLHDFRYEGANDQLEAWPH